MQILLYNFYLLAVQNWCNSNVYQIHGLWSNIDATHYPTNCGAQFSLDTLLQNQTLVSLMKTNWNNDCSNQTSQSLWEHEYNKHGSCISKQTGMTQNEVFSRSIDLFLSLTDSEKNKCYDLQFQEIICPTAGETES